MFGDDRLFENLVQAGEEIEADSDKNVDEERGRGEMDSRAIELFRTTKLSLPDIQQRLQDEFGIGAEESEAIVDVARVIVGESTNEEEVKETQEPLTKQDIQFAIGELQDKLAGGEHASTDDLDRWTAELDKLEAELKDAPDESEFESKTNEEAVDKKEVKEEEKEEEKVEEGAQEDYDVALGSLVALVSEFVGEDIPQEQIEAVLHNLVLSGGAASLDDAVRAYGNLRAETDIDPTADKEVSAERWAEDVHPELSPSSKKRYVADVDEEEKRTDTVSNDPSFERTIEKFTAELKEAQLKEGQFSWHAGDTDEPIYSTEGHQETVYLIDDKGNKWQEDAYEGYGVFGGKDFYILLGEMNGLELSGAQAQDDEGFYDDRSIAIKFAFGDTTDDDREGVKYPKLTTNPDIPYEKLPNPRSHENQGWWEEEGRDERDYDDPDYDERDDEFESKVDEDDATEKCAGKKHVKEEEVDESYGSVYIEADLHRGMSREAVIKKLKTRYPDIDDEEAEKIVTAVEKGEDWPRRE